MTPRVGMKVTLKDEVPWAKSVFGGEIYPVFGAVYTIRSIRPEGSDRRRIPVSEWGCSA